MPRYYDDDDRDDRGRRRSWEEERDDRERYSSRRDREDDDYDVRGRRRYDDEDYGPKPRRPQGSAMLGVSSFVIGLVAGLAMIVLFVIAGVMSINAGGNLDENSPEAIFVGLCILGDLGLAVVGLILGLIGAIGDNRGKVFAWLGVVINGLFLLGTLGLMVLGLAVG